MAGVKNGSFINEILNIAERLGKFVHHVSCGYAVCEVVLCSRECGSEQFGHSLSRWAVRPKYGSLKRFRALYWLGRSFLLHPSWTWLGVSGSFTHYTVATYSWSKSKYYLQLLTISKYLYYKFNWMLI